MIFAKILMFFPTNNKDFFASILLEITEKLSSKGTSRYTRDTIRINTKTDRLSTLEYGSLDTVFVKIAKNRSSYTCIHTQFIC